MSFIHGRTLSRCAKGEVLAFSGSVPTQQKVVEDQTLYTKKKKGKYKKTEWTEEKIKALAARLEAARREIKDMRSMIEELDQQDAERKKRMAERRRKAEEMKQAFAFKYKKMREGTFEFTPLPEKQQKEEKKGDEGTTGTTSSNAVQAAPAVTKADSQKSKKKKHKSSGFITLQTRRKSTPSQQQSTGEDREWAAHKFVYERRVFDKIAVSTGSVPTTTAATSNSSTSTPASSSAGTSSAAADALWPGNGRHKKHAMLGTLGRHVTGKGKSKHRQRKALDLEEATQHNKRTASLVDFRAFFSTETDLPIKGHKEKDKDKEKEKDKEKDKEQDKDNTSSEDAEPRKRRGSFKSKRPPDGTIAKETLT